MNTKNKSSRNPWPIVIITYFILFFSFTVGIVAYISHQKMDLVRGDYYDDEIRYQEQLDRMNRTLLLKTPATIAYDAHQQTIKVIVPNDKNQSKPSGRIRLYRPSDESLDQEIKLAVGPDGAQCLDARKMKSGLWKVRVYWTAEGQDYCVDQAIVVIPTRS